MLGMFALIILGIVILSGLGLFLLKIGVIVNQASKPPHIDHGNYSLDQGREVGKDD